MTLTYIHHSCFVIEDERVTLIFDFYKDTSHKWVQQHLPSFKGKIYVFASHAHSDYFNRDILQWKSVRPDIQYLLSKDIINEKRCAPSDGFLMDKGDVYHDELVYVKAFGSTDQGISFYVETGGKTFFHAGDLNDWHWKDESTPEEIAEAEAFYQSELNLLAAEVHALDVAMYPLDPRLGTDFAKGAVLFLQRIKTGLLVPMHCQGEYAFVNRFGTETHAYGCRYFPIVKEEDCIKF